MFDPADPQVEAENRSERLLKSQERVLEGEVSRKEDIEWAKKPYWEKYDVDHINGIDDGEPPGWYYDSHREEFDL